MTQVLNYTLLLALPSLVACGSGDEPLPVMRDGRIVEVRNCAPPSDEHIARCRELACQQVLYERKLLPPNTQVVKSSHSSNYSDDRQKSMHIYKYVEDGQPRYPMCEMQGDRITRTDELSAKEQNW